jgi:hypothetical protein
MAKRKAMTKEKAREVRSQGHADAFEFALAIGLSRDYKNDAKAKKDVIDLAGDAHSVKSGNKRWQIFLYSKNRFETDDAFQSMNGIGQLLIKALDAFPNQYADYIVDKEPHKRKLRQVMRKLKEKFSERRRVKTFLGKAFFNGAEVNYLTVKHEGYFHVFYNQDIIDVFGQHLEIVNSQARKANDTPEQKILFRYKGINLGELEIRNSGKNHYKEVLFVMNKLKVLDLLFEKIKPLKKFNDKVVTYGKAIKKFGHW